MMSNCKAYRELDQMVCGSCGLAWSVGDTDVPVCKPIGPKPVKPAKRIKGRLRSLRRLHGLGDKK